jgi:hypothetical protein
MNWDAISTIAEIVGAGGVILSLLFLGLETRKNTKTARASLTNNALTDMATFNDLLATNPETRKIIAKSMRPEIAASDISSEEWEVFIYLARGLLQRIEGMHNLYEEGLMSDQLWTSRLSFLAGILKFPIWQYYWDQEVQNEIYTPNFIAAVEQANAAATRTPKEPNEP